MREKEGKLQKTEGLLRQILDHVLDVIVIVDTRTIIEYVSPSCQKLLSYTPEEITGRTIFEFIHPDEVDKAKEEIRKIVEGGESVKIEFRCRHKNGFYIWFETAGNALFDENGNILGAILSSRDITGKKLAEQALEESERRFKDFLLLVGDFIWEVDKNLVFTYCSENVKNVLGYTPEEVIGKSPIDFVAEEEKKRLAEKARTLLKKKEHLKNFEVQFVKKNGETCWLLGSGIPIFDEMGKLKGYRGILKDITNQRRVEQALREASQFSKQIISSAQEGIVVYDKNLNYLVWNNFMEKLTGVPADKVLGKNALKIFPHLQELGIYTFLKRALEGEVVQSPDMPFYMPQTGKSVWVSGIYAPYRNAKGEIIGVIELLRDVTKRKESEEALKRSEEKFRKLAENAPVAIFIYRDNKFLYVNRYTEEVSGYTKEELFNMNIWDLVHPDFRKLVAQRAKRRLKGKDVPQRYEFKIIRKDGKELWGDFTATTIDYAGKPAILGMCYDITERKRAEEALKRSEEKFRKLAESAQAAIFIHKGGKFCYVNSYMHTMLGYSKEELLQMNFWDVVHPDFREMVKQRGIARSRGEAVEPRNEFKVITKSGEERWVDFTGDFIDYGRGKAVIGTAYDITDHKRAEEALKLSEEKYRFLFEYSPSINIIIGTDGKIKDISRQVENSGYTKEELIGKDILELVAPHHREKALKALEASLKGEDTSEMDIDVIAKDGSIRTLLISRGQALLYKDGKLDGILVTGMDITNTKIVEESIIRAKQEWERTFDSVPDLIMILDSQFRILRANKALAEKLGMPIKSILGRRCYEIVHQSNEPPAFCPHKKSLDTGEEHSEEMLLDTLGGYYLVSSSPIYDSKGNFIGSVHVARDITERKIAEDAIRSKLELENTLLKISSRFVGVIDFDKAINESLADIGRLAGADRAYVFLYSDDGKTMSNTHEWCAEGVCSHIEKLQNIPVEKFLWWNERLRNGEIIEIKDTSELPEEARAEREEFEREGIKSILGVPLYISGNVAGFVGFDNVKDAKGFSSEQLMLLKLTADIFGSAFERKRAESEKAKLEEELLQSQKMEALGRLAGGIAHDFNNLLTSIIGYSQMVLTSINPLDPLRNDIEEIKKAAERGASLTKQLLTFSRKHPITPKVINLNEIILNYKNILSRIIGEDIDLIFVPAKDLGNVKIDQTQFEQVLINLVINARDAMPHGGKLIIETKNVTVDENFCRQRPYAKAGEYVMLSVSDTGVGMDEETQKHIFEPFFTTKESGTGLGLAIVYGIVKQNGGFIDVTSAVGVGSTFKIYLPRVYEKTTEPKIFKKKRVSGEKTILLVEDENMLRGLIKKILQTRGYKVLEAKGSTEALSLFEKHKNKIKLLIADVLIPDMSGWELYEKLKAKKPKLKVIFTSGYTEEVIGYKEAIERGIPFIQKPFTIEELLRKVREVLEG